MRIIDISPLISERLPVWPGDVPYRRTVRSSFENGDRSLVSSVETTLHLGSHADAPGHAVWGDATIEAQPLDLYYGPCQVIEVRAVDGGRIGPADLAAPLEAPRVLLRTDTHPRPERFGTRFVGLSPGLAHYLAEHGVVLVGIDTPSVDPFDDPVLESHVALAECRIATLEGLVLKDVEPGLYTLIALPLKLEGADASPVRAALLA